MALLNCGGRSATEDHGEMSCDHGAVGDTTLERGLACVPSEAPQSGDCPENRFGVFLRTFTRYGCDRCMG